MGPKRVYMSEIAMNPRRGNFFTWAVNTDLNVRPSGAGCSGATKNFTV